MPKRTETVPCPRYVKGRDVRQFEDEDTIYPRSVSERERDATLPKHVGEGYEECPGEVTATICWTPLPPNASPELRDQWGDPEVTYGACPECGCDDWTTAERKTMADSLLED